MDKEVRLQRLRQLGFGTKGMIYVLLGALVTMAAFGLGGKVADQKGVMLFLIDIPAGKIMVAVAALGLVAYTLWRFYLAYADPRGEDVADVKRYGVRVQYVYSGLFYGSIAFSFAKALFGKASSGGDKEKVMLGKLLETNIGPWLIGAIALGVAGQAIFQGYLAFTGKYMIQIDDQPEKAYKLVKYTGRIGYYARFALFAILSYLLLIVILDHNADAYDGTTGAFRHLLTYDYGRILMGVLALGFLCYGLFCILVARFSNMTKLL